MSSNVSALAVSPLRFDAAGGGTVRLAAPAVVQNARLAAFVELNTSSAQYASNLAAFACNAAAYASNLGPAVQFASNMVAIAIAPTDTLAATNWACNTAVFASNTAVAVLTDGFASNTAVFASNLSPAVTFASNLASTAAFASNLARPAWFASNLAPAVTFASNLGGPAVFGSNLAPAVVFASNVVIPAMFASNLAPAVTFASNLKPAVDWASNAAPAAAYGSNLAPAVAYASNLGPAVAFASNLAPTAWFASNLGPAVTFASNAAAAGSNLAPTAWFASNLAPAVTFASNLAPAVTFASNLAPAVTFACNAAVAGSNAAGAATYASNNVGTLMANMTASDPFSSNTAVAACNLAVSASVTATSASNAAAAASAAASAAGTAAAYACNTMLRKTGGTVSGDLNIAGVTYAQGGLVANAAATLSNAVQVGTPEARAAGTTLLTVLGAAAALNFTATASNVDLLSVAASAKYCSNAIGPTSNAAFTAGSAGGITFASNTAVAASNTAIAASNTAAYASNAIPAVSTAAAFGSNAGGYGSNAAGDARAQADSALTAATFASNAAVTASNYGIYTPATDTFAFTATSLALPAATTVTGSLLPSADSAWSLGSAGARFASLYVAGSTIYLGSNALSSGRLGVSNVLVVTDGATQAPAGVSAYEVRVGASSNQVAVLRADPTTGQLRASVATLQGGVAVETSNDALAMQADVQWACNAAAGAAASAASLSAAVTAASNAAAAAASLAVYQSNAAQAGSNAQAVASDLRVGGALLLGSNLQVLAANAACPARQVVLLDAAGANDERFVGVGAAAGGVLQLQVDSSNGAHVFVCAAAGGSGRTELARLTGAGSLGVGTSAPSARLHVAGGVAVVTPTASSASNVAALTLRNDGSGAGTGVSADFCTYAQSATPGARVAAVDAGAYGAHLALCTKSNAADGSASNAAVLERVRVTEAGRVGVATSNPACDLDVLGAGRFTSNLVVGHASNAGAPALQLLASNGAQTQLSASGADGRSYLLHQGDLYVGGVGATTRPRLYVASNGWVGLGTSNPNASLQFDNALASRRIVLAETANNDHQVAALGTSNSMLRYQVPDSNSAHVFSAGSNAAGSTELMRVTGAGLVGIGITPSYTLHVNGQIYATGDITGLSDCNLKADIRRIRGALDKIDALGGYTFVRRAAEGAARDVQPSVGGRSTGVLAQEVRDVLPEAVYADARTGRLSVAYGNMVGLLLEGVKELRAEVAALRADVRADLTALQRRVTELECWF